MNLLFPLDLTYTYEREIQLNFSRFSYTHNYLNCTDLNLTIREYPTLKDPQFLSISWLTFPNYSELILQDDLKSKLHEENSDFKATNRNEENTLFLDTIDTSSVFKRETSNTLDIITGADTHEDDLNHLLFKTVQAQLKVQSTNTNNSTNNAASSLSSLQPKKIQLIANNTEFGDFCNFFLWTYCMKRKKMS